METKDTTIITTTSIRVQADIALHENGECTGELYSDLLSEPYKFNCIIKMLTKMETIFDEKNCPENYTKLRTFGELMTDNNKKEAKKNDVTSAKKENTVMTNGIKKCMFDISVKFRQNATWQGEILWAEKNTKQNFRSVLEMLMLINEAMNNEQ